jgi:hypothetical protein
MKLFQWLGKLLDDLLDWLGELVKAFLEGLIWALQKIWETAVAGFLIAAFGSVAILYVIFYAGAVLGETIMEVWDPLNSTKPSEVFSLEQAPQDSPLPKRGSNTRVLKLQNWK